MSKKGAEKGLAFSAEMARKEALFLHRDGARGKGLLFCADMGADMALFYSFRVRLLCMQFSPCFSAGG